MTDVVTFAPGFRAHSLKPHEVRDELRRIRDERDELTAEGVFEEATPEDAKLHPEFEWDGDKAIRELGLIRARRIIRSIVVQSVEAKEPPRHEYVHIVSETPGRRAGEYVPMTVAVQSPDLYELALTHLQRKVDAAVEALNELRSVASKSSDADRLANIGLVVQGFGAVREALALLK
jgi:hypothetical protein